MSSILQEYLSTGGVAAVVVVVVDILIVYYVIYRILLLLKGTRALQMLVGLCLFFILLWISRLVGLITINWILDNFLSNLILVVIVLFQHDIRRALARVGSRSLLGPLSSSEESLLYEELIKTSVALAHNRHGALIALEREADLTDYTEEGAKLDAGVTKDMLLSIFSPASPIHDGAVVIQGGRITAAHCFLPLTINPRVSRSLGSRHRAAIGLTELTDAVVILVSEETGKICLVEQGKVTRDLDGETLRRVLHSLFRPPSKGWFTRGGWRR